MGDEDGFPGVVSRENPGAARGPNGIWDEEMLQVVEWEAAEHRLVLPDDLRIASGLTVSTYRWAQEKLHLVRSGRAELASVIENLASELRGWQWTGTEKASGNTRILFIGSDQRYYSLTLGEDRNGSWNVITIVGSANPGFARNRLRGVLDIRRKD